MSRRNNIIFILQQLYTNACEIHTINNFQVINVNSFQIFRNCCKIKFVRLKIKPSTLSLNVSVFLLKSTLAVLKAFKYKLYCC